MHRELLYLLCGLLLSVIPAGAACAEPVGQWRFDEGTGTIAADATGNGNDGILEDDPAFVDGKFGYALAFDRNRVVIPVSDSLTAELFQGPFTLCTWINPTRTGSTWQQIFRSIKMNDQSNDTLFINNDGRLSWRGRVGGVWTGGMCETGPGAAAAGQWTHVAVTGDGSNFRIYVNGDLSQVSTFRTTDGTNTTYYIGGDSTWIEESYTGIIDDFRLHDHAVSQANIRSAMQTQGDEILKAWRPSPADGAIHPKTWVNLSWVRGSTADSHDVYFGEDLEDVETGAGGTFRGNQTSTSFLVGLPGNPYPAGLVPGATYYWRIDEVQADGGTIHKGSVWSFLVSSAMAEPSTVSTFNCIGIYWSPPDGGSDNACQVRYRSHGSTRWKEALPLWYDDRELGGYPPGYRGSIVNLDPGTVYDVKLTLLRTGAEEEFIAQTWSEEFPIAKTVYLPAGTTNQTLEITQSGSPDGYILYTAPSGGAVIDVRHNRDYCITVNASYVIISGLDLRGANVYGIRLYNCHDVVIERCDISDFSSIEDDGWGNRGSAIFSNSSRLERIIVQRNKMHHPYSDTNSWSEYRAKYHSNHPRGPTAIGFGKSSGNHVIRYNEIYSDENHYFDDCMGAGNDNFPNRDSDIYGNYIANCWDDGIEAEDDNCNVRIWGNFIEWTFVKIAVAPTRVGPVYVWRNVAGVARGDDIQSWNDVSRGGFLKTDNGGGKIYVFHNTLLQPEQPRGVEYPLGCGRGLGWGGRMLNTMSRNNILDVCDPKYPSIKDCTGVTYHDALGDYDYDLFNGHNEAYPGAEPHGINAIPVYDPGNDDGEFALHRFSPGYDAGEVIANFNDNYKGAAPDLGAHEANSQPMEFGVNAYR